MERNLAPRAVAELELVRSHAHRHTCLRVMHRKRIDELFHSE
jgi:hypothetical protein